VLVDNSLRVLPGGAASAAAVERSMDPVAFQESCLRAFEASQVARGFAQTTMDNGAGVLERFLLACGRPAWEVTREDVDRVVAGLVVSGVVGGNPSRVCPGVQGFPRLLVGAQVRRD
jgi:integrase/recombinase XerD